MEPSRMLPRICATQVLYSSGLIRTVSVGVLIAAATLSAQVTARFSTWIQAEDFSSASGVSMPVKSFKSQDPQIEVAGFSNGNWIRWDGVNFLDGQYDSLVMYYWSSWPQSTTGATVQFRLDSPTGTVVASMSSLSGTGAFGYQPSTGRSVAITRTTGAHTLYLTVSGGGTDMFDVDKIRLAGIMTVTSADMRGYYVDASIGSDTQNDGSSTTSPFKTIQKAASVMKPGATCYIRAGVYRETVKPVYTGLVGAPLTFQAYNGENVVISGADPITGWTTHTGSIYKAPIRWTMGAYKDQLLVDGKMAWVARSPNVDEHYVPHQYQNWCGGAAGLVDGWAWRDRVDPLTLAPKVCLGTNGTQSIKDGNFGAFDMDITNSFTDRPIPAALLNRPTDFFKGGLISNNNFYWSSIGQITGSSSASASKTVINAIAWNSMVMDANGPGWVSYVFGLLDAPNEWFRQDSMLYLWSPDGGDPSHHLVEAKRRVAGFDLRGKEYVTLTGIRFIATSATLADASHCIVDGCHFKYVSHFDTYDWYETGAGYWSSPWDATSGYSGIYISGHDNVFRNGSVAVSAGSGIILAGRDNTVTNNHIHDCNYTVTYQAGILVYRRYPQDPYDALTMTISHNTLKYCGRANFQIGFAADPVDASQRTRVSYNDFGPAAFTTKETGSMSCSGSKGVEVDHNWFHGTAGLTSGDIVMEYDFGGRHYIVHHNVFWQGESIVQGFRVGFHWAFDWNDTGTSASTPNSGGAMCFNNTVVDSCDVGHKDWDLDWPGYKRNNIMAQSDTAPWAFTDPRNRDYTLRSGSKAIDKGIVIPQWVTTYQGTAPDLGAYEHGEPRWVAGADWQEQVWVYPPPTSVIGSGRRGGVTGIGPRFILRAVPGSLLISDASGKPWRAELCDARGRIVASHQQPRGGAAVMPTRQLACGVYMVRVSSQGATETWRTAIRR